MSAATTMQQGWVLGIEIGQALPAEICDHAAGLAVGTLLGNVKTALIGLAKMDVGVV